MLHGDRGESSAGRGRDRRVKGTVTSMPDDELPRVDEFIFHRDKGESSAGDNGIRLGVDGGGGEDVTEADGGEDCTEDDGEDDCTEGDGEDDCTEESEQ